jgi:hypothetical protein
LDSSVEPRRTRKFNIYIDTEHESRMCLTTGSIGIDGEITAADASLNINTTTRSTTLSSSPSPTPTQHNISLDGALISPSVDGLQFNGIEAEGDFAAPSANGQEEGNAESSTTTSDGGGGDGDGDIVVGTSDSTTVAVKKTWKRTMPKKKKKKNGHGNAKQSTKKKSRAQYNAEVVAAAAAAAAVAVDNQPDETETTDPALLPLAKPPSQLIRMIASRDNTINSLKTKRKASDEKVAALQVELKKTKHELHRDRKQEGQPTIIS